ncbi:hypothetical protein, partial [Salmonella sp. s51228]
EDHLVFQVSLDHPELRVQKETEVSKVHKVQEEISVLQDLQESLVQQVHLVVQDHLDNLDLQEILDKLDQ